MLTECPGAQISTSSDADALIGCNRITGDLTFGPGVTRVELPNLIEIDGWLSVFNRDITSLQGLRNLKTIGTELSLLNAHGLTTLQGLESLQSVGTRFIISNCSELTSVDALTSLTTVGSDLSVSRNRKLPNASPCALAARLNTTCRCTMNLGMDGCQ